jgi:tetratricopeptide (TPR) repeat protein
MTIYLKINSRNTNKLSVALLAMLFLISFGCSRNVATSIDKRYVTTIKGNMIDPSAWDSVMLNKYAADYVIAGSKFEQQGLYADAILEYFDALKYDSAASIYNVIAKNYNILFKYKNAEEFALKAIQIDSTFWPALDILGQVYLNMGDRAKAAEAYEQLVKIHKSKKYFYIIAGIYETINTKKALEYYQNAISDGEDVSVLERMALLYRNSKDTVMFMETVEKLYTYKPMDVETNLKLIAGYLEFKEYDKAIKALDKADSKMLDTEVMKIYDALGNMIIDDTSKSVHPFISNFIGRLDNRFYFDWRLQFIGGLLSLRVMDTSKTEGFYKRAMNVSDSMPNIPQQLAWFYLGQKRFQETAKLSEDCIKKFPTDFRFPYLASLAYYSLDSIQESITFLHLAYYLNSKSPEITTQLGIAYDRMNLPDSSDFYYEKSLELDPKDPLANNNYAYTLALRKKDLARAKAMSEESLRFEPENTSFLDTYAWIYFQSGKYEKALEFIQKALNFGGKNAELYEHLGDIFEKLSEKGKAIESWRKSLEIDPDNFKLKEKINKNK